LKLALESEQFSRFKKIYTKQFEQSISN